MIAAVHPGLWHPGVLAKWVATADHLSNGRVAVNVVTGWFKDEFTAPRRALAGARRALPAHRGVHPGAARIWTEDDAELAGDFYRIRDFSLKPKPLDAPGPPAPGDLPGRQLHAPPGATAGRVSDWYFSNGKDFDGVSEQIADVREPPPARAHRRRRGSASTASSSPATPRRRPATPSARSSPRRHAEAVEGFGAAVRQAGQSTADKQGHVGRTPRFEDLVQYNDGFRTR